MGQGSGGVAMSCDVGLRHGSDPALLWLWRRMVAIAPIRPPAWEPPYAEGAAKEIAKRHTHTHTHTKKKKKKMFLSNLVGLGFGNILLAKQNI